MRCGGSARPAAHSDADVRRHCSRAGEGAQCSGTCRKVPSRPLSTCVVAHADPLFMWYCDSPYPYCDIALRRTHFAISRTLIVILG